MRYKIVHRLSGMVVPMLMLAVTLVLWSEGSVVMAQPRKVMNRPYIDQRPFHYGFLAGLHAQDIEFTNNGYIDENGNQWFADVPNYDLGFTVGIEVARSYCASCDSIDAFRRKEYVVLQSDDGRASDSEHEVDVYLHSY